MNAIMRLTELRLALMMLTRLPAGRLPKPAPTLAQAAWAFPLVGIVVGAAGGAMHWVAMTLGLPPLSAAFVALLTMVLITGALHQDGLADFADGLGGGRDKAHCLEIMRDSRIGSYGVLALVIAVGLQVSSIAAMPLQEAFGAFLFMSVASRVALVALLLWLPPAREDGLGRMAWGITPWALAPGVVALATVGLPAIFPAGGALLAMVVVVGFVGLRAKRRIGGQTGDVLGAAQMTAEVAGWVVWTAFAING